MKFFLEKISRLTRKWNRRPMTEDDFHRLCRREKITVDELPLVTGGFYYSVQGRHFIAIDSRLRGHRKLFVMYHEFAHYLMHAPETGATANFHGVGARTRKETEADAFALCALVPKSWIESRSDDELIHDEGIPADMVAARRELYRRRGL
jgi:Zn-dependent peptidase ImmA (M78 family)